MNEQLAKVFNYGAAQVRTVVIEGEPWFVARDVCEILGIGNARQAASRLDDDERNTVILNDGNRGNPNVTIVNEPGLYSLILSSRKPEARAFKRWITHEVLPDIRKYGGHIANDDLFVETYLPNVDSATQELFRATLGVVRSQNETIGILSPKADYFDALVDTHALVTFRETAKELHVKETALIRFLLDRRFIYRKSGGKLFPYAKYAPKYFDVKDTLYGPQTYVTPLGRDHFRKIMAEPEMTEEAPKPREVGPVVVTLTLREDAS